MLALSLAACASSDPQVSETPKISDLEQQLSDVRAENSDLEQQIAALKDQESVLQQTAATPQEDMLLPPQAKAGECYARVFVPPTYRTLTEEVVEAEASEKIEVIPARYGMVNETVLIKEESERVEVIPATFKTVEERILVREAYDKIETVPAVYGTQSERMLVKPAYTTWKKGRGPIERIDEATGEIMCLVEIPAEYRTVSKQVLKSPATTRKISVPAEYRTITKTVIDQPARTQSVKVPAEYSSVQVRKLLEPSQEKRMAIPARYQSVSVTEKVDDGRMEWRPILCETNTTPGVVTRIQSALATKGYSPGPVDGVLGPQTMSAVNAFQQANNMSSGQLTIETVKALGVQ
ncbi:peptidoglycan-binding domain-containing protein [Pelagibius litoralis]|nr:peptidoglycan-binding domain-containing protein [Pelagibius litoralis]